MRSVSHIFHQGDQTLITNVYVRPRISLQASEFVIIYIRKRFRLQRGVHCSILHQKKERREMWIISDSDASQEEQSYCCSTVQVGAVIGHATPVRWAESLFTSSKNYIF